jgi:hypothetical protein
MKPPPHGGLRGLCGLKGAYKSKSVFLPSPVVSSSILMGLNKGSSGGTERAVADQVSNCLELHAIVSKMKSPFASACILAFLDFQPSRFACQDVGQKGMEVRTVPGGAERCDGDWHVQRISWEAPGGSSRLRPLDVRGSRCVALAPYAFACLTKHRCR